MKNKEAVFTTIKGKLIVSCQVLPEESLHSSYAMGKMVGKPGHIRK